MLLPIVEDLFHLSHPVPFLDEVRFEAVIFGAITFTISISAFTSSRLNKQVVSISNNDNFRLTSSSVENLTFSAFVTDNSCSSCLILVFSPLISSLALSKSSFTLSLSSYTNIITITSLGLPLAAVTGNLWFIRAIGCNVQVVNLTNYEKGHMQVM